jgi:hypothetical protein
MVQRAARVEVQPPEADQSSAGTPEGLGPGWLVLRDCRIGPGGARPTVLMHPARGVAVLDILPSNTPGAVEALRARLAAARFPAIFAGHLPMVHLQVAPRRMPLLPSLLDDAFAAQPPLRLPGGNAWVGVAARTLTAEQPVRRLDPRPFQDDAAGPRRRRKAAALLRTVGAVLLCLVALGGVLGAVLNKAPAPSASEAVPVAAAAASAATPAMEDAVVPRVSAPLTLAPSAPDPAPAASPVPAPLVPDAAPAASPFSPARSEAVAAVSGPEVPSPALPAPLRAEIPPPPPALPSPQRAAASPLRRSEAAAPAPAAVREAPERAAPRRQREAAAAVAAPSRPEAAPDRCRRVSALVGSGAPLAEADMRFFNEACIRW